MGGRGHHRWQLDASPAENRVLPGLPCRAQRNRQHQIMAADRLTDRRVSRIVGAGARERC
jgi:hypothetical protein